MGRRPTLTTVSKTFQKSIQSSLNLFIAVKEFCVWTDDGFANNPLHPSQARRVVSLAFFASFVAWEQYIADVFIRYLAGAQALDGSHPKPRIGFAQDLSHAAMILSGSNQNLSWTYPGIIRKRAELFFDHGHPFADPLKDCCQRVHDARKIRNRIAHSSQQSRKAFKELALQQLGFQPTDSLPKGYSPGDLLVESATRGFGARQRGGLTIFEAYMDMWLDLDHRICKS